MTPERFHYVRGHRDAREALDKGNAATLAEAQSRANMQSFTGLYWYGYVDELQGRADWLCETAASREAHRANTR